MATNTQSLSGSTFPRRRLLRVKEAALYLGMSHSKVRQLAWTGQMPFIQECPNALMLFDIADLDRWIDAHKEVM